MSYQVLARKWRPRDFASLVGQDHVVKALVNALDQQRLHHAYLFAGTRGVGKTTVARILAKALNCERGVSSTPCGECGACREVDEGRMVDLLEIDAASRTKVEDTRELLDNVQYSPTRARYKIYLIDEVHMLSTHSFNALLKTLEEPPPHVKFLLATTDPQKLPVTVLSRCLQFNLRNVPAAAIAAHLRTIVDAEQVPADDAALQRVARAAGGSIRDALSLLDQAIVFGGGEVSGESIAQMLGDLPRERVYALLALLAAGEAAAVLAQVEDLARSVSDYSALLDDVAGALQRLAVHAAVPEERLADAGEQAQIEQLGERLSPEEVQLFYQIALIGKRDLPLAPDPRSGFEMVLLRMLAFRPAAAPVPATGGEPERPAPRDGPSGEGGARARAPRPPSPPTPPAPVVAPAGAQAGAQAGAGDWHALLPRLELRGLAYELAANCELAVHSGRDWQLRIGADHANLVSDAARERIEQALRAATGTEVRLQIEVGEVATETPGGRSRRLDDERYAQAREAIAADPLVRALQDEFGAELKSESVRPADGADNGQAKI